MINIISPDFIFVSILALALLLVSLLVYIKDTKSATSRFFLLQSLIIIAWLFSNHFSNVLKDYTPVLVANRLLMASTTVLFWVLYVFTANYPKREISISKKSVFITLFPTILVLITDLSPALVSEIVIKEGFSEIVFGPGLVLYLLHFALFIVLYSITLIKKSYQLKGIEKIKLQYLFTGITLAIVGTLITNLIFPLAFNNYALSTVGPVFLLVYIGFTALSIIENRLFGVGYTLRRILFISFLLGLPAITFYLEFFIIQSFRINPYSSEGMIISIIMSGLTMIIVLYYSRNAQAYLEGNGNISSISNKLWKEYLDKTGMSLAQNAICDDTLKLFQNVNRLDDSAVFVYEEKSAKRLANIGKAYENIIVDDNSVKIIREAVAQKKSLLLVKEELLHSNPDKIDPIIQKCTEILVNFNIELLIATKGTSTDLYIFIFGTRYSQRALTSEEISYINDTITNYSTIAISRARLFTQVQNINTRLEKAVAKRTEQLRRTISKLNLSKNKLKDALAKLTALDQAKSEFISMASHQLRTPVSIIRGYMSMFKEGDFGRLNADQIAYAEKMEQNLIRLNTIIDDILNASRIEANRFSVYPSTFDLSTMVTQLVDQFNGRASKKGLKINLSLPKEKIFLEADKDKLLETISNIIDNGINYTLKGHISVKIKQVKGSKILIEISDTGIGIPKNKFDKIFQRFARLDNAKKVRPDGTGIGLYLAKAVVEAHKGTIWFESEEGKGTTFFIEIPKKSQVTILPG